MGAATLQARSIAGGFFLSFEKNGSGDIPGAAAASFRQGSTGYTNSDLAKVTAVLLVSADDWFQLRVAFSSPSWSAILANSRSWLALEVVETEHAAETPADIVDFKLRRPGHPPRVHLAGSPGSAGTAATAETDVDIRRNGNSFATMRFAAAADTATFIAATETVLEPGDAPSTVAPTAAYATLADIGFNLVGTLLI